MQEFDVIIIGAGPAGCAAAYDLLKAGLNVVVIDKRPFPRTKPCAGGFTVKALNALRFPIDHLIQQSFSTCKISHNNEGGKLLTGSSRVVAMTVRGEFDAFHLKQCQQAGASFQVIPDGLKLEHSAGRWLAHSPEQTLTARHLIGADGAHSQVRKTFKLFPELTLGFALETTLPHPTPEDFEMTFDFGVVDQGYGWVFPKKDHVNIGLYSLGKIPDAKRRLAVYAKEKTGLNVTEPILGHPIPLNGQSYRHQPGNPYLVGDAAGLIDPLLGEGLYNAIRSGQLGAQAILAVESGKPDPYDTLIKEITRDLKSYQLDTRLFYRYPALGVRSLMLPPIGYCMMKGYALGKPIRWLKHRLPLLPFLKV